MKYGRRLTAVGMLTGGLLLVGFAAPSLADVGSADGTVGATSSSVTTDVETTADNADSTPAEQAAQPQDATSSKVPARASAPSADESPVTALADNCTPTPDNQDCNGDGIPDCGDLTNDKDCDGKADDNGGGNDPTCSVEAQDYDCNDDGTNDCGPLTSDTDCDGKTDEDGGGGGPTDPCAGKQSPDLECSPADFCKVPDNQSNPICLVLTGGGDNGGGNGNGGTPPGQTTPPGNSGGNSGGQGPGTSAGGSSSSNGSGSEGTVPGANRPHRAPGTSACGDPAICNDSGILGVDASNSTPTTTSLSTVAGTGSTLPETGAAAGTQGLLVVGFGLLAAGALLVRPRRPARHRA